MRNFIVVWWAWYDEKNTKLVPCTRAVERDLATSRNYMVGILEKCPHPPCPSHSPHPVGANKLSCRKVSGISCSQFCLQIHLEDPLRSRQFQGPQFEAVITFCFTDGKIWIYETLPGTVYNDATTQKVNERRNKKKNLPKTYSPY